MALSTLALAIIVGAVVALVVHELGHVLAAGALGGHGFRLTRVWPALRIEATLPPGPGHELAFLAGGAVANVGAAAALWGFGGAFAVAATLQLLVAALSLLPFGDSDGARILALRRASGR